MQSFKKKKKPIPCLIDNISRPLKGIIFLLKIQGPKLHKLRGVKAMGAGETKVSLKSRKKV